tara:strand:- start:1577 stop:2260 length:684 start_codon:yes stop_codon:yes gene_type:complete
MTWFNIIKNEKDVKLYEELYNIDTSKLTNELAVLHEFRSGDIWAKDISPYYGDYSDILRGKKLFIYINVYTGIGRGHIPYPSFKKTPDNNILCHITITPAFPTFSPRPPTISTTIKLGDIIELSLKPDGKYKNISFMINNVKGLSSNKVIVNLVDKLSQLQKGVKKLIGPKRTPLTEKPVVLDFLSDEGIKNIQELLWYEFQPASHIKASDDILIFIGAHKEALGLK